MTSTPDPEAAGFHSGIDARGFDAVVPPDPACHGEVAETKKAFAGRKVKELRRAWKVSFCRLQIRLANT